MTHDTDMMTATTGQPAAGQEGGARGAALPVAPVAGVIFDCDGTLMDSMAMWHGMEDELAGRAGHAITEAERAMLHTLTLPETLTFFHGELGLGKSEQDVADMMEDYLMRYYAERSVMRPGALEFVRELRARGIRCSIASSTPHAMLVAGCEHTGLAPLVSAIVSTDDVGASKREPAVYDRARELMGTPVAATWVFEDAAYALRTLACTDYRTVGIWDQDEAGTFEELSDLADVAIRSYAELDVERFVAGEYARKAERA